MKTMIIVLWSLLGVTSSMAAGPDSDAREVLSKFLAAQGGVKVLQNLHSLRTSGSFDLAGGIGTFVISRRDDGKYRAEVTMDGRTYVSATDGKIAWRMGDDGKPTELEGKTAELLIDEARNFPCLLIDAEKKGIDVTLVGKTDVDGTPAFHLSVALPNGRHQDWFIDQKTYLLVMKKVPGWSEWFGDHQIVTWAMDYRQHEGLMLPMHVERESNETFIQTFVTKSVDINPKLDDALFCMPQTPATAD